MTDTTRPYSSARAATDRRPRLGFVGLGWIGRHRMEAVAKSGLADIVALCDADPKCAEEAQRVAPGARVVGSFEDLLAMDLDGVVVATPNALHAAQAEAALKEGAAVFCQKPLGRNAPEVRRVVDTARRADLLLGVDLSYRHTRGMQRARRLVQSGELGNVYAADLVFHNAYGPDKAWFYERSLSGGGCVMDLGVHLVDLALWTLGHPRVEGVDARVYAGGNRLHPRAEAVEDYAVATLALEGGRTARIACSWRLHAGEMADISASFHGTAGGVRFRNVNGSFYDFVTERHHGTSRETLDSPPDEWGGRALVEWTRRLAQGARFDAEAERLVDVAETLDRIYHT